MKRFPWIILLTVVFFLNSCYRIMPSEGGGQISGLPDKRMLNPADVLLPQEYRIEVVARGLTFPTAVAFDDSGTPYVIEAGYAYGEIFLQPKLFKIETGGELSLVYQGEKNGPWNGITFHDGFFYIAEGGELEGGKILKVSTDGTVENLVEGLPSVGDHHTNGPVVKDGYIYFGQGTATNSGVVGEDNANFGWLQRFPDFRDIPCKDITVNAVNSETKNFLTEDPDDKAITGPYSAFNSPVTQNQVIKGAVPCTGAVMRVPIEGGDLEVVAWGFRNPYGMALSPNNEIYITQNSYDVRGSRPVWGTGDLLFKLEEGAWYGWPDFNGELPLKVTKVPGKVNPEPLMAKYPGTPPAPVATFGVHSSSNGISFSRNNEFGFPGEAFVAQFGDMAPSVGKVLSPVGFKVVRVNVESGIVEDFAVNSARKNGPASLLKTGGLERPVSVKFNPAGDVLYIVDFGIMTMSEEGPKPLTETGVVWKVTKMK